MKSKRNLLLMLLSAFLFGCTFYTLVDGSSKYDTPKTINITQFENNAGNGPPNLAVTFTEKTKDFYIQNGKFELTDNNGTADLKLESEVTAYQVDYSGANAGGTAQQYKLSITVKIDFTDFQSDTNNVSQSFTRFEQFDASLNISDVETELIDNISEQIAMDIFNNTVMTNKW